MWLCPSDLKKIIPTLCTQCVLRIYITHHIFKLSCYHHEHMHNMSPPPTLLTPHHVYVAKKDFIQNDCG